MIKRQRNIHFDKKTKSFSYTCKSDRTAFLLNMKNDLAFFLQKVLKCDFEKTKTKQRKAI